MSQIKHIEMWIWDVKMAVISHVNPHYSTLFVLNDYGEGFNHFNILILFNSKTNYGHFYLRSITPHCFMHN